MKSSASLATKVVKVAVSMLGVGALGLGPTGLLVAQSIDFNTEITIAELMEALVMPEAEIVWNAVRFSDTGDGDTMLGPETDQDWLDVRRHAMALAEVANTLMIPGRAANTLDASAGEGELSPAEIEARIDENRDAWNAYAQTLHTVAMQTVEAVDARDVEAIFFDIGGTLDEVCESCHRVFWYPDQ